MLDLNTFILIAVAASIGFVGVLAWLVDSGLNDKMKVYVRFGLFGMFACILGLFFLIEDDSEFQYGGYTAADKSKGGPSEMSDSGSGGSGGVNMKRGSAGEEPGGGNREESDLTEEVSESDGLKQDCPTCPEIVPIKKGKALLGSQAAASAKTGQLAPASDVAITQDFGIGKYEVTFEQFSAFSNETGYKPASSCKSGKSSVSFEKPGFRQSQNSPAVCVSFKDALAYVEWLTMKTKISYRLPTEVEWEYAARAGITEAYLTGEVVTGDFANFKSGDDQSKKPGTSPVGSYPANGNDMHDVHGNVWELTADCWSNSYLGVAKAPDGNVDCKRRVAKGGAWYSAEGHLNFSMRVGVGEKFANNGFGFRVVRENDSPVGRKKSRLSNGFDDGVPQPFAKEPTPKKISYDPETQQLVKKIR